MKKLIYLALSLILTAGMLTALSSCIFGTQTPQEPSEEEDGIAYIIKDGKTDYTIAYGKGESDSAYAQAFFKKAAVDYACTEIEKYLYTEKERELEIVIGDTDRSISAELKAAAEAKKTAEGDFVWAYGYKNGKLGFYANSELGYELGWSAFLSAIMKSDTVGCDKELWTAGVKTYAEHKAELDKAEADKKEEETKQEQAILAELSAQLAVFDSKTYAARSPLNPPHGVQSIQPTTAHPRVYVSAEALPTIKANLTHEENKYIYQALLESANAALAEKELPSSADKLKASMLSAENLAFVYLVTGQQKYGYKAILYALNYIDAVKSNSTVQSGNEANTAIHVIGEVYDWCYDLLTEKQKDLIIDGTCKYVASAAKAGLGYPPYGAETVVGHGSERPIMRDWLAFAIAVSNEASDIYNYVAGRVINEYTQAPDWYYQSGLQHQGSAYGTMPRLYPNMAADILIHTACGERIFNCDLEAVAMTVVNRIRPDDEQLRYGDDFNQASLRGYYPMVMTGWLCFFTGSYYKNATAKSWFKHFGSYVSNQSIPEELSRAIYLILNDPTVETSEEALYDLELVHYNPSPSGSMVVRSAWGDPSAWLTYTNIEETSGSNHDHMDAGTFQIYYKGILAPDTGMYEHGGQYYNSSFQYNYVRQIISKNGLIIYNPSSLSAPTQLSNSTAPYTLSQWPSKSYYEQAKVLGQASGLDENGELVYAYLSGDVTKAYSSSLVDLVMRSTMTLATGDAEHPMVFLVYDRITSDNADYKKSAVLHTMEEPSFIGGSTISAPDKLDPSFTYVSGTNSFYYTNLHGPAGALTEEETAAKYNGKYNGKLTTQTLLPENPIYRYIGGDGKRFWIAGGNGGNGYNEGVEDPTKYPVGEVGWGRIEISPSENNETESFLNLMYVSDAKDAQGNRTATEIPPSRLIRSSTHEGAVTFGSCVMFSMTNARTSAPVSFSTEGETGELNYYVTGLTAGRWSVSAGGNTLTVTVSEASGMAVFTAPAGAVTLTKAD